MVDVKSGYSKARASNSDDEAGHSSGFVPSEGDSNQEESLASKPAAVEDLPDVCGGEDLTLPEEVRQLSPERDDDGHDQVGECGHGGALGDVHLVDLLEIFWLCDEEQVECPGSGEVCDNDGPDWEASEDTQPRRAEYCWCFRLVVSDRLLNIELLSR